MNMRIDEQIEIKIQNTNQMLDGHSDVRSLWTLGRLNIWALGRLNIWEQDFGMFEYKAHSKCIV